MEVGVTAIACTKGQEGVKGVLNASSVIDSVAIANAFPLC
jgi:hypothetical protein